MPYAMDDAISAVGPGEAADENHDCCHNCDKPLCKADNHKWPCHCGLQNATEHEEQGCDA